MGHHHRGTFVIFEGIDQAFDAFHVQVVRRFVEQQHVAGARQDFSEEHAAAFTTAQHLHLL